MFIQLFINGIVQGAIYALGALGFALIYGVMRLVQFAHGDVMMLASYFGFMFLGFFVVTSFNVTVLGAVLIGGIGGAIVGLIIERIAFRPLRSATAVASSMATMGIAFILRDLARLIWGPELRRYTDFGLGMQWVTIGDMKIPVLHLWIVGIAVFLVLGLQWLLFRTRLGLAIRAIAQNPLAAEYIGIDSDRVIWLAFGIGSGVAGVGGVLIGLYYNAVWPTFGFLAALRAFSATVLGGLTSVGGAIVGGLILGIAENFGSAYIGSNYREVIAFLILFVVLIIKPSGIFGKQLPEMREG